MNIKNLLLSFLSITFISITMEKPKKDSVIRHNSKGKVFGSYLILNHALEKINERDISPEMAIEAAKNGKKYIFESKTLCVDSINFIVAVTDSKRSRIITTYRFKDEIAKDKIIEKHLEGKFKFKFNEDATTFKKNKFPFSRELYEDKDEYSFYLSDHALQSMHDRCINFPVVEWIILHGDRYHTYKENELCIHLPTKFAVLIAKDGKTVLEVFRGIDQKKLADWIALKNAAIKQAIIDNL